MLALMAGRNAGEGVTLVKEGKVSQSDSTRPQPLPPNLELIARDPSGPTSTLPHSSSRGLN